MTDQLAERTGAEEVAWDLTDLYSGADDPALERDLDQCDAQADAFSATYRGRVATLSAAELSTALHDYEAIQELITKIYAFANLQWTTNTGERTYGALLQKITERHARLSQKLVFFDLEWAALSDEQAHTLLNDPALAFYKHYLEAERRYRPHLLSEGEEKVLSEKSVTGRAAWNRFFDETLGASRYDLDGEKVPQEAVLKRLYFPEPRLQF